ncbi:MAG: chorismate-binding protein [Candidatus Delongbacteria bacterium]|nr:chorismate-binding protein [Candidatus Delongbacteria bacterium]
MNPDTGDGALDLLALARRLPGEWLLLAPFAGRCRLAHQPFAHLELHTNGSLCLTHEGRRQLLRGPALAWVEELSRRWESPGAGWVSHDHGAWLHGQPLPAPCENPLLRFAWYRQWQERPVGQVLLDTPSTALPDPTGVFRALWPRQRWLDAVEEVRARIRRGDVYQVNLVQPFETDWPGEPAELWRRLLRRSRPGYCAMLHSEGTQLLSLSPEQFLLRRGSSLETLPIKGTVPAGPQAAQSLLDSAKDRAELAMIVDLLRNDLSRVCRAGSVATGPFPELLELPTVVHSQTRVRGELLPGKGLQDCFEALFPCGSIVGCPRSSALECLRELEGAGRGLAMGAIGLVEPDGDFSFSVAIRTARLEAGRLCLKAGGGITWASDPMAEYLECLTKVAAFAAAWAD